jgi:hypothetical protein
LIKESSTIDCILSHGGLTFTASEIEHGILGTETDRAVFGQYSKENRSDIPSP